MSRPLKVILLAAALAASVACAAGCGTEKIKASRADSTTYAGAVIFSQRCAGCHTFSYAGTHGSASNIRDAEWVNGPNFDQRCERPVTRVLYAIENGGFSGLIMPQNVVVGQQAREVAEFVAKYSGGQQARSPGVPRCSQQQIGTLPPLPTTTTAASTTTTAAATPKSEQQTASVTGSPSGVKSGGKGKGKGAKSAKKKK